MSTPRICLLALFSCGLTLVVQSISPAQAQDEDELAGIPLDVGGSTRLTNQVACSTAALAQPLRWYGLLESQREGEYRLAAQVQGRLEVKLRGATVLTADSNQPQWIQGDPISLAFDAHPLEVTLRPVDESPARVTLFWSGPGFPWEPVPAKRLLHRAASRAAFKDPTQGQELSRALRCDACHAFRDRQARPLQAPALSGIQHLNRRWLVELLTGTAAVVPHQSVAHSAIRNLHAGFDRAQANDVAAYLDSLSPRSDLPKRESPPGNVHAGRELCLSLGCLACHQLDDNGTSGIFSGGNLSNIAAKRPASFFDRWLADPASVNRDHRMPVFELTAEERAQLASFLATLTTPEVAGATSDTVALEQGSSERGRQLVDAAQCGACHRLSEIMPGVAPRSVLTVNSDWSHSCMLHEQTDRPNYRIEDGGIRAAVREAISGPRSPNQLDQTEILLAENNCLNCHGRDGSVGLATVAQEVAAANSGLAEALPALMPPSLNSVGDKLHRDVLRDSISRRQKPRRPWLRVRMPKFPLDDRAIDQLADYFIACDRVPDQPVAASDSAPVEANIAERLVTADGFGCTSCHAIGKSQPDKADPKALGPDLSMLGRRVRKTWFDRWVRNPIRIVPRMEMPSVQLPVFGILDNDLDRQLNAVWEVLNQPGFHPPDPQPIRIVRGTSGRAVVLTDVLNHRGQTLTKPFLIGLPNGHNVLFDLEQGKLAGWWAGDTAKQRTKGKAWYWQSGADGWLEAGGEPEIALLRNEQVMTPARVGQFTTEADEWTHIPGGLQWKYRLVFSTSGGSLTTVTVTESITGQANDTWRRTIRLSGLLSGDSIKLTPPTLSNPAVAMIAGPAGDRNRWLPADQRGDINIEMRFIASRPLPAPGETVVEATATNRPIRLQVVPGFEAVQLALPTEVMPIAIGWRPDQRLILASLKGRVWLANDLDGDQLEDELLCISDELAAPYGLHASESYLDVVNKYGVVRMWDRDGDDVADHTALIASGWGHTPDYHDWAVGLPMDESGNYYVAIPCQQDDRSLAAARYRGCVLRLRPRAADELNPRRYELEQVSGGHRFPMGIAMNRQGQLVVTDNQGNYNPFNELNHVIEGKRYGFINKFERSPGFRPELTPPAIAIPHPWTRSVNGICFLETPAAMGQTGHRHFGPFEGHLLGCEYDTRRLIRMSLELVDGVMQGAAYPLSRADAAPGETTFQGPICCDVAPDGEIYVGNIRDSGWGGANNSGSVVRLVAKLDELPCGIAEVTASRTGFRLAFTRAVDPKLAADVTNYAVESYRRESTPAYGGEDIDRRKESPVSALVSPDGRSVMIGLRDLRLQHVYEFKLKNLTGSAAPFFPAEAHYTLNRRPTG